MDRIVTLEDLSGVGHVHKGTEVVMSDVPYEITVSRRMIDAATMSGPGEVPGMKRIDGVLVAEIPSNLVGESIELELEDGRRWKCFIQSRDGNLVSRGGGLE
jgi:hypothetical protein